MILEKLLYKKISLWILFLVIILSIISMILFGSLVLRSTTAKNIAKIPETLKKIFIKSENDFILSNINIEQKKRFLAYSNNHEDLKGYLLLARYDVNKKRSVTEIINIKDGKVLHTWEPDIEKINTYSKLPKKIYLKRDNNIKRYLMYHPLLLSNGDLIMHSNDTPLIKLSICSKMIWHVDKPFHHSTELDHEQNIWSPSIIFPAKTDSFEIDHNRSDGGFFREDSIDKISQDGKILFSKSLIEIFIDNNLERYIFPTGNEYGNNLDPFHLNDIQPAVTDSKYWKKGDLFLSLKHLSMILLYRPSTNKIIWFKQGPWVFQHDVDIINNKQIAVFDNNRDDLIKFKVNESNETLIYDFEKDIIISPYKKGYIKNQIKTPSQGLSQILENGDIFVEDTDHGRILRMDKMGNIKWQYVNREPNGYVYRISWSRFLSEKFYSSTIEKIINTACK